MRLVLALALLAAVSCDGCFHDRSRSTPRCGACTESTACRPGLACTNGVCETAPPSCHVQIGL
jgi:hypothetical protein